ncbi:hypothetical protein P280DRAFT_228996 [Massarina eburnea CBS 473.64]|uniref:Rab-GAP TBC domain-containing protein n=1 Tax=Massarina eburnea CBS 473.64 TaxID=1395130 RepID=A0A6A6SBT4_9PLEO|nr:hypothetical protein P280DRAFT_228996 [Massarina eburnea CBS 473.64]
MPTALFAHQHHTFRPGPGDDEDVHYIHHSKNLYIISEDDYVHSLIPEQRVACALPKAAPPRIPARTPPRTPPRIPPPRRSTPPRRQPRPLMTTLSYMPNNAGLALGGGPDSPPDLTTSKSSKSSSFHSGSISDMMGPGDLSHFEDINLDDIQGPNAFPLPLSPNHRVLFDGSRPSPASRSSAPHAAQHSFRDLTGGKKPRHLNLKGQGNNAARPQSQLHAPAKMRRGFTSPSVPTLGNMSNLSASDRHSRSPSPAHSSRSFTSAPRSLSRKSSHNLEVSPSSTSMSHRRQSWNHGARKTAEEREAECDDEDDDELPEDAIIWNVPISPRPMQDRSPAVSAAASSCGSPPQDSPSPALSRPGSRRGKSPAGKVSPPPSERQCSPPAPIPSEKESFPSQELPRQRHTWETTYTTLDADAKKLTEALEEYQTEIELQQEIKRQQPQSRSPSVDEPKRKAVSLPPIRKSDPLIDPFQPSVEKTKYLSRTRPSWLPPKDPKEEKKHLREYQQMLARIEEAERLEVERQEKEAESREKAERIKAEYWSTLLLPNWETEMSNPELKGAHRKMWWNGIPPKLRGAVWRQAVGNELGVTEITYNVALEKAQSEFKAHADAALNGRYIRIVENTKDVFPQLRLFAPKTEDMPEQPFHQELVNICVAYSSYRPDVDTTAGIHHIAALFLLNMSAADSFITLSNLLNCPLPLSFLVRDQTAMTAAYDTTLNALSKKRTSLSQRLASLRVEPHHYLLPMYSSLFCDRLSVEHAARVMDVYTIEGDKIPPRVAVGIMTILEGACMEGEAEDVAKALREREIKDGPDAFMVKVFEAGKSGY